MWGASVRMSATSTATRNTVSQQVARVSYHRPESWRFWMGARLLNGDTDPGEIVVIVKLNLIIGVGRSVFRTSQAPDVSTTALGFAFFRFSIPGGTIPGNQANNTKYTTTVTTPPLNDSVVGGDPEKISIFPAQDIQVEALMSVTAAGSPTVEAEATAYFAPNVHIRPEWYSDGEQFRGMEVGGT